MEKTNVLVIGAGVVGLAVAEKLSGEGKEVILCEKHKSFGRETSSRNSEVIHAGFYYPHNSLKAKLCVPGNRMLYEFCAERNVPHKNTGKILVANRDEEEAELYRLFEQGKANGVQGMELLTKGQVALLEPHVSTRMGLFCPTTGMLNTHQLMLALEAGADKNGATIAYGCEVQGIERTGENYSVSVRDADGELMVVESQMVVNAGGLHADEVAAMAGIDIDREGYRLHLCKGEYFAVSNRHRGKLSRFVYPAPTPISLGIHAVLGLDGSLKLGPNAFYVNEINYDVNPDHLEEFYHEANEYLPFIDREDLRPDQGGIRPKLQAPGEGFRDFIVHEESNKKMPGFVNLIGIESPGLTSCLSLARMVSDLLNGK